MRKLCLFLSVAFLVAWVGSAWAGRPPNTPDNYRLRRIGTALTANGTIARGGQDVAMVIVACGSSACTATLADPATDPGLNGDYGGDDVVVVEVGAAANTTVALDLTESPISFSSGIEFNESSTVSGVTVYGFGP